MPHRARRYVVGILLVVVSVLAGWTGLRAEGAIGTSQSKALLVVMAYGVAPESLFASRDVRLMQAVHDGTPGLMNTTTPGRRDRSDGYASVAFGARALGGRDAGVTLEERGVSSPGPAVHTGMSKAVELNSRDITGYGAVPGVIGDALSHAHIEVAAFGTADKGTELHREAAMLVARSDGRIAHAFLRNVPFTDTLQALSRWLQGSRGPDVRRLSVLELGYGTQSQLMDRLALTVGLVQLLVQKGVGCDLLFVSPGPRGESKSDSLTPVLLYRPTEPEESRVLASASTRRTGVVLNADVAPTALNMLGVPIPNGVIGRPAFSTKPVTLNGRSTGEWLLSVRDSAVAKSRLRVLFVTAYVAFLSIVLFYIIALYVIKARTGRIPTQLNLAAAPLLVLWWPIASLIIAYWAPNQTSTYAVALVIVLAPAVLAARSLSRIPTRAIAMLAMAACALVVVDQLLRGALIARALMSYDIQTGARFYGMGNEYMGIVVGAFILWLGATSELRPFAKGEAIAGALLVAATIGAPILGANVGGLITAIVGFGAALLMLNGKRISLSAVLGLLVMSLGAVAIMSVADVALGRSGSTHLAGAAMQIGSEGLREAVRIVTRKLAMNARIIAYTPWNLVFLAALGSLIFLVRPRSPMHRWRVMEARHAGLARTFRGALVASVVALLFNDSGVVAASLAVVYPFYGFAFIVLSEEAYRENPRT